MRSKSIGFLVLVGLFAATVPNGAQASTTQHVWNPAQDFQVFPNQINPSPDGYGNPAVWSYLRSDGPYHDPSHYQPFTHYTVVAPNVELWDTGVPGLPFEVGIERSLHLMILHPHQACFHSCNLYSIIGWTSPINGVVDVVGDLSLPPLSACDVGSGINWSVDKGATSLVSGQAAAGDTGAFSLTTRVWRGETLYFVDDAGSDTFCDQTLLNLNITEEQGPASTGAGALMTSGKIHDRFSQDGIDSGVWMHGTNQPNHISISEGAGHVTVNVAAATTDLFFAGVGTICAAHGDFDARVTFNVPTWPLVNGVWVSLIAQGTPYNTYRASAAWFDSWGAYLPPAGDVVPATGTTGTLRLARKGSVWTGYYLTDHNWVAIASGPGPTDDIGLAMTVFNVDATAFGHQAVVVQFTDFHLDADAIVCPGQ